MVLHDILLALNGHPGDVIVEKEDPLTHNPLKYEVNSKICFLSTSEKEIINKTVNLGFYYSIIDKFVRINQKIGVSRMGIEKESEKGQNVVGLYARALCCGLDELLTDYRDALLKIEQSILQHPDSHFPLSELHLYLREYLVIFPEVGKLVERIQNDTDGPGLGMHGGQIFHEISNLANRSGIPSVKGLFERLLYHCHKVLVSQMTSWLVFGLLADPYDEFFIQQVRGQVNEKEKSLIIVENAKSIELKNQNDISCKPFVFPINLISQKRHWSAEYALRYSMLPSYIPHSLAEKILFVGRAVCILQHPMISKEGLLPAQSVLDTQRDLFQLREKVQFDSRKVELELVIDRIRVTVTMLLWELVARKADLNGHLLALKDFLLLARGEFYQLFQEEANFMMSQRPGQTAARDLLKGPWSNAASKLAIDENSYFWRFKFRMDKPSFTYKKFSPVDFLTSTRHGDTRGLECVGCTRRVGETVHLTGRINSQSGALWFSPRPQIGKGFTTSFRFRSMKSNFGTRYTSKEGFAFLIQNKSMQVRASRFNKKKKDSSWKSVCKIHQNCESCRPLFEPIEDSISIEFRVDYNRMAEEEKYSIMCYKAHITHDGTKELSILGKATCHSQFFNGRSHKITIKYDTATWDGAKCIEPAKLKLWIGAETKAALVIHLVIKNLLENKCAWIGLTGATGVDTRYKWQVMRVESWEFKAGKPTQGAGQQVGRVTDSKDAEREAWEALRLEYHVDPPLDLVLLKEGFDRYNLLWRFLFKVKKVQVQLHQTWHHFKSLRNQIDDDDFRIKMQTLILRSRMQFVVDNLQFYLQVDVLEVQYHKLIDTIEKTKDFEQVRNAHEEYLAVLTQQCFLHDKHFIIKYINRILSLCMEFCHYIEKAEKKTYSEDEQLEFIKQLSVDFDKNCAFLFGILSKVTSKVGNRMYLAKLKMRIDYNFYFSRIAEKNKNVYDQGISRPNERSPTSSEQKRI